MPPLGKRDWARPHNQALIAHCLVEPPLHFASPQPIFRSDPQAKIFNNPYLMLTRLSAYLRARRLPTTTRAWHGAHDSHHYTEIRRARTPFTLYTAEPVQSALSDPLTTSATHGTLPRPSTKRGLISIIKLMQFTIVRFL